MFFQCKIRLLENPLDLIAFMKSMCKFMYILETVNVNKQLQQYLYYLIFLIVWYQNADFNTSKSFWQSSTNITKVY